MSAQHRNLVLLRHAKSAYPDGVADHDRPLAPRGIKEAGLAGDWLRANLPAVDAVLCSTATRARETLARVAVEHRTASTPGRLARTPAIRRAHGLTPSTRSDRI